MKLAYFLQSNIGSSETFIYDLVKGLNEDKSIDLTFITGENSNPTIDFDLRCIPTGFSKKHVVWEQIVYIVGQLWGRKGVYFKMHLRKWISNKVLSKYIVLNYDVALIEYATSGVLVMDYLSSQRIPFIVHVHGYDITSSVNDQAYLEQLYKLFHKAAFFIVASNYMKRRLILLGCAESKIKVITIGIDSKSIIPMPWQQRIKIKPSIIFLGRLIPKKNPIALIHAFKLVKERIPESILSLIGDGPLRSQIKELINDLGLSDSIYLHGVLNRQESFPLLNSHWVYAQHSVTSITGDTEGFAISLAEAALHELPVVSTIHNGITENVIDGETGFLIPEYNYEAMAEKIIFLIQNPLIAEKMGKAGRKHIIKLCDSEKRLKEIKALLFSLKTE